MPDDQQIIEMVKQLPDRVLAVAALAICEECLTRINAKNPHPEAVQSGMGIIRTLLATDEILATDPAESGPPS